MFQNRTIALIKARAEMTLVETCKIQRETSILSPVGAPTHTWVDVVSDVACRVIEAGQNERSAMESVGNQESMVELYRLITPVETPFKVNDRVVMSDGRIFHVVQMQDGLSQEVYASAIITRQRPSSG
jgi:hypothetical protein